MSAKTTTFVNSLRPDAAVTMPAGYRFDGDERQYVDKQIRDLQQMAADNWLNGVIGSFYTVDTSSPTLQPGDVVCVTSLSTVTLATPTALNNAVAPLGVVLLVTAPGGKAPIALFGLVGPQLTGLGNVAGYVRVSSAGRCERVGALALTDYAVGTVSAQGYLTVRPAGLASGSAALSGNKFTVRAAKTSAGVSGLGAFDGFTPSAGDRVLRCSGTSTEAGIWIAASGAWTRATDFAAATSGAEIYVQEGTDNATRTWRVTTRDPITWGTTAVAIGQEPSGNASEVFYAHSGEVRVTRSGGVSFRDFNETADCNLIKADGTANNAVRVGQDTLVNQIENRVKTGGFVGVYYENGTLGAKFTVASNCVLDLTGSGTVQGASNLSLKANAGIAVIDATGGWYLERASVIQAVGEAGGIALHANAGSYGGGTKVLFIGNASANPGSNPTGGGILYSDSGAGKWRGSGGTVTTFGPAEPHCPTCGRDYAYEARHDDADEHLAICWSCMLEELEGSGLDVSKFAFIRKLVDPKVRRATIEAATESRIAADTEAAAKPRAQWRARQVASAEARREAERQATRVLAAWQTVYAGVEAEWAGETEHATWSYADAAEQWAAAGHAGLASVALGRARECAAPEHLGELDQIAADLGIA